MLKEIVIFGQKISCYALFICLGFLVAIIVLLIEIRKKNSSKERWNNFFCILPILIIGGFFGAIFFDKIAHFKEIGLFELAGMSFAGGAITALILFLILYPLCVSKNKIIMHEDLNLLVCPFIIAHSLGRIGCFMGGCCYGIPTNSIFGVTFPEGSLQNIQYGYVTKVLPTQLFESAFLFVLFLFLLFFKKLHDYKIEVYLIAYGVFRFLIEFIRGDNRGTNILFLSPSQWASIFFIIIGIVFLIYIKKKIKSRRTI